MGESFAGREAASRTLAQQAELARAGHPRLLMLEGPAGIGKTAFVDAFLAGLDGFQVVRASGDDSETELAFGVIDQLARVAGVTGPGMLAPAAGDHLTVGLSVLQLLGRLQDEGPVALVIDDAHWADRPSLHALLFATRRLVADAVLVIMVVREETAGWLLDGYRRLADGELGARLRLGPLPVEALRAVAASRGVELSARTARRLHAHTGGSPLHARALLDELPPWAWVDAGRPLPAPRTFAEQIARRLAACPAPARRLTEAAAVLAGGHPLAQVAALAGVDEPFVALEDAMAADLLRIVTTGPGTDVAFASPLVEAAVRDCLGAARRAELHAAAAALLADDERLALRHRVAASPGADAELARKLERYAAGAAARGAWTGAAEALLAASRVSAGPADRARRLLDATDAFVFAGDIDRAVLLADDVGALPGGPRRDAVLGHVAQYAGPVCEAERLLLAAWAQCDAAADPALAGNIARGLAMHWILRLDGAQAERWGRRAFEVTPRSAAGGANMSALAAGVLASGLAFSGRIADAERALQAARDGVPADNGLPIDALLGWLRLARDDVAGARALLAAATPAAVRLGSHDIAGFTYVNRARADFAIGAWDEAVRHSERAVAIVADHERMTVRWLAGWSAVLVRAARGEWEAADAYAAAALARHPATEEAVVVRGLTIAPVAAARGRHAEVIAALEPLVRLDRPSAVDEPGLWAWQDMYADALIAEGRLEEAAAFLPPHATRAAARGLHSAQQRLARSRGKLEAASARPAAAADAFRAALAHAEHVDMPFERALTCGAYGSALRRQGKRRAAAEQLRSAHATFVALGAAPYAERCARELEACGLAPGPRADRVDLTPQERAVAQLVAAGRANRETAAELLVSVKTVEVHLTRIYAKLGIRSRAQLAARLRDVSAP